MQVESEPAQHLLQHLLNFLNYFHEGGCILRSLLR
nr:MAG TPA: hypothetical protein [Caudoviricetes sp.]